MRAPAVAKLRCNFCGYSTVSRVAKSDVVGETIRRLRICTECRGSFSTVEQVVPRRRDPHHRSARPHR
jgi:transcriptional regulator NrdR family protein